MVKLLLMDIAYLPCYKQVPGIVYMRVPLQEVFWLRMLTYQVLDQPRAQKECTPTATEETTHT